MSKLLEMLVSLSVAGSAVVICILLLRFISPGVFPAKWRYAIGKMAIGFYLLPVALVMQTTTVPISAFPSRIQQTQSNLTIVASPELNLSADVALFFLSIWGTGAFAFAVWQIYCYRRFMKKLQQTRLPVPDNSEAAEQLRWMKEAFSIKSNVLLAYSSAIRSPALVGLWKPTIYLPMETAANVDLGMVFRHELIHLKRKDLWIKALTLGASALHWFNPFVHILQKEIHMRSELSCDEEVVKEMSYAERKRYGETILNVMAGSRGIPVRFCASLSSDAKQLKRRLNMILNVQRLKKKTVMIAIAAVIAIGTIGASTAVWAAQKTPEVKDAGDSILYHGVQYLKFSALTPDDQKFVIEEGLGAAVYVLEGYEHPVFSDELTHEEQARVTIEEGYFSPASIARLKDFREKFPRGVSVTITHQEDPSIPPGTSLTIRSLTPEESAVFKKREEEARAGGSSNDQK